MLIVAIDELGRSFRLQSFEEAINTLKTTNNPYLRVLYQETPCSVAKIFKYDKN